MPDTVTTAYGLTKPEIGASEDTWGEKINTDLDTLDTVVNAIGGKTAAGTLSYANSAKLATTATGVDVTGTVTMDGGSTSADFTFGDNDKAIFGAGSDLQIYYDGSKSIIADAGSGNLQLRANDFQLMDAAATKNIIRGYDATGAVGLHYGGSEKLATTSTGIDVTGTVTADGLTVDGAAAIGANATKVNFYSDSTYSGIYNGSSLASDEAIYMGGDAMFFYAAGKQRLNINAGGDISFYEDTGTTPKFFWDASAESLGIGTSSPARPLQVAMNNAGATVASLKNSGATAAMLGFQGSGSANDYNVRIGVSDNTDFTVATNNTEAMRIDSSGNVGIGTSSPSKRLHLYASSDAASVRFENTASNKVWDITPARPGVANTGLSIHNVTDSRTDLHIDNSGNVGIGTTTALGGPSAATAVRIGNQISIYEYDDGSNPVQMNINQNIDANENYIVTDHAARYQMRDGVHKWFTVGSGTAGTSTGIGSGEVMQIDSSGNLLVGTTSTGPAISSTETGIALGAIGYVAASRTSEASGFFNRLGTDGSIVNFNKDGTTVGSISSRAGTSIDVNSESGDLHLQRGGTTGLVVNPTYSIPGSDAGASLGISAQRWSDLYLSGGVYLGGTGAANKLDDYEEGTFDPQIFVGETQQTLLRDAGYYVKVGNLVHCSMAIIVNGAISGSGSVSIRNFPFNSLGGDGGNARAAGSIGYTDATFMPAGILMGSNTVTASMHSNSTPGTTGTALSHSLQSSALPSNWNMHFSVTYVTY